jgi:transcriptional regulator with XRE-family HTH domain
LYFTRIFWIVLDRRTAHNPMLILRSFEWRPFSVLAGIPAIRYDPGMSPDRLFIQAWRISHQQSIDDLADKTGIPASSLEAFEAEARDIPLSTMELVARGLGIPVAWLHTDPAEFDLLFKNEEEEIDSADHPAPWHADPLFARIRQGSRDNRSLYTLLTALLEAGDPKLTRAAEVSLKSLLKQARQTALPWQSRPPGHFEPPSD